MQEKEWKDSSKILLLMKCGAKILKENYVKHFETCAKCFGGYEEPFVPEYDLKGGKDDADSI